MTNKGESQKATEAQAALNRPKAIEMKLAGATYQQIADALGVGRTTAHSYVMHVLAESQAEALEGMSNLRHNEIMRCERLILLLWTSATKDGATIENRLKCIAEIRQLMNQKAKYEGTYTPQKIAPTNVEGTNEYTGNTDKERASAIFGLIESTRTKADGLPTEPRMSVDTPEGATDSSDNN